MTVLYICRINGQKSRELLAIYASQYAALRGIADPDLAIGELPSGKPCFPNTPMIHFSISHSGEYWICAFSDSTVGADIQLHTRHDVKKMARRFYSDMEYNACQNDRKLFFDFWAAREAYLKYTGEGVAGMDGTLNVSSGAGVADMVRGVAVRRAFRLDGYSAFVCGGGEIEVVDTDGVLRSNAKSVV